MEDEQGTQHSHRKHNSVSSESAHKLSFFEPKIFWVCLFFVSASKATVAPSFHAPVQISSFILWYLMPSSTMRQASVVDTCQSHHCQSGQEVEQEEAEAEAAKEEREKKKGKRPSQKPV